MFGGMPHLLSCKTEEQKISYLNNLFKETYIKDIVNRNNLRNEDVLEDIFRGYFKYYFFKHWFIY